MSTVKHVADFVIDQPARLLFPLFSAEGEKLWVPGWDYTNIMGSTDLHEDYIFLTKDHDHASTDAVWLVKKYEPEQCFIQLYKVEPGEKVGIVTVQCHEIDTVSTRVEVGYDYVGLSSKGDEFIEKFTLPEYRKFIGEWHTLLVDYFNAKQ